MRIKTIACMAALLASLSGARAQTTLTAWTFDNLSTGINGSPQPSTGFGIAGALGMGMGTRALAQRAASHPAFINSLAALSGGRLVPIAGIEAAGFGADTGGQQAP